MARKSILSFGFLLGYYKHVNLNLLMTRGNIYNKNNINKVQRSYLSYATKLKSADLGAAFERHQSTIYSQSTSRQASGCPICSKNLTFTYKDVLLLSQFLSPEGNILNRRITGVCRKQQRKLENAIEISRRLGLIPRKPPAIVWQSE